jgi:hypothetical protein
MSDILKGNFSPKRPPKVAPAAPPTPTEEFEREALKRLGGSIAFVSKAKFIVRPDDVTTPAAEG